MAMRLRAAGVFLVLTLITAVTPAPAVAAPVGSAPKSEGAATTGLDLATRSLAAAVRPLGKVLAQAGQGVPERLRDLLRAEFGL